MNKRNLSIVAVASFLMASVVQAAVTPEEAATLKSSRMPLGGERAGSKDGSIPAWEDVAIKVPSGWKQGDLRPDPFAGEKPILEIKGSNADQYADKLSEGTKALLKKYPTFRLVVYPSHRTAAAPAWMYENTLKNATRAKTKDGGLSIEGARGGVPFPIPKDANEVMWNHLLAWNGQSVEYGSRIYIVQPDGKFVLANQMKNDLQWPYYANDKGSEKFEGDFQLFRQVQVAPPFKAGESILVRDPLDMATRGRQAWQYLLGQRRVRRAPTIGFDTPDSVASGQGYFDEAFVFNGSLEMYQWNLIGRKEMFIPYNENRFYAFKDADLVTGGYVNPDAVRWELHRVWVVEATLAPGKRHVLHKRRFYVDEDSWHAVMADGWDAQGQLWRTQFGFPFFAADGPGVFCIPFANFNLMTGTWVLSTIWNEVDPKYKLVDPKPDSYFTPDSLAGHGVR